MSLTFVSILRATIRLQQKVLQSDFTIDWPLLVRFPESGEQFVDSRGRQYRRVSFGNYVVYFRSVSGKIEICRLVHGAQQIDQVED
jgi:plasmid stabilization system protein ParE